MNRTRTFLENLVILAIVLVLVQTFLEDLATLLSWSVSVREALLVAGFVFDLFFTVEFIVRGYDAWRYRRFGYYFWYDRGWIDFLASVPLLVLNSGPAMLAFLAGGVSIVGAGSMLNVLKVVKAIRIARVLRLLRVLKVFRRIKNADSVMAQRHLSMISATSVSVFVFALLLLSAGSSVITVPSLETEYRESVTAAFDYIANEDDLRGGADERLSAFARTQPGILVVETDGKTSYSKYDQGYFDRYYRANDYTVLEQEGIKLFVDLVPLNQEQAAANLRYFIIIVAVILTYLLVYSPHFALTVTDPIHVMRRGMSERNYSLEVKIPAVYRQDDVYRLAAEYNRAFLPMKDRERAAEEGDGGGSALSLGDIDGLFDE
jgi:hypothetical protein